MKADQPFDSELQLRTLLARGWQWRDPFSLTLVHPQDYNWFVVFNREAGTFTYSAALLKAMELVILTPSTQNPQYWSDDKRAHPRKR